MSIGITAPLFFRWTQERVHQVVVFLQEAIEIPGMVLKVIDVSVAIFSFHAPWAIPLQGCKQAFREIKSFLNWVKGLQSIDGFLNGPYSWKAVIRNLSSFVLLILSTISLADGLRLLDTSALKVAFASLPVFGILPFGGLLPLAFLGLFGMMLLLAWEKKERIAQELQEVKNKNHEEIEKIREKVLSMPDLAFDQKAFRLKKLQMEEKITNQAIIGHIILISKQILGVAAAFSGWGVLGIIGVGLEGIDGVLTCKQFFEKRALRVLGVSKN